MTVKQRLMAAYLRGFRAAVAGARSRHGKQITKGQSTCYSLGYELGLTVLRGAEVQAERVADYQLRNQPN